MKIDRRVKGLHTTMYFLNLKSTIWVTSKSLSRLHTTMYFLNAQAAFKDPLNFAASPHNHVFLEP